MIVFIHLSANFLLFLSFVFLLGACQRSATLKDNTTIPIFPPQVQAEQWFFYEKTKITGIPPPTGYQIHYTTDGSLPDENSPILEEELEVRATSELLFRTIGEGQYSESSRLDVFRIEPNRLTFAQGHTPGLAYDQSLQTLTDTRKANKEDRVSGWWGYQAETINLVMDIKRMTVHGIALSFLEDQSTGMFGPVQVEAAFYDAVGNLLTVVQKNYASTDKKAGTHYRFLRLPTNTIYPTQVSIEITNLPAIPEGFPNAGDVPLLLLDEVLVW